ncbi:hypothetical protein NP493_1079g00038, partial [Ridgeia piscesae]
GQLRVATRQRELAEREVLSLKERLRAKENSLEEMIADLKDMKPDRKTQEKLAAAQEQDKKVAQLTEETKGINKEVMLMQVKGVNKEVMLMQVKGVNKEVKGVNKEVMLMQVKGVNMEVMLM